MHEPDTCVRKLNAVTAIALNDALMRRTFQLAIPFGVSRVSSDNGPPSFEFELLARSVVRTGSHPQGSER